jgi:hypothetical protein
MLILFELDFYSLSLSLSFFFCMVIMWSFGRERNNYLFNVVWVPIFELNSSSIISLYDWIIVFGIIAFPSFIDF